MRKTEELLAAEAHLDALKAEFNHNNQRLEALRKEMDQIQKRQTELSGPPGWGNRGLLSEAQVRAENARHPILFQDPDTPKIWRIVAVDKHIQLRKDRNRSGFLDFKENRYSIKTGKRLVANHDDDAPESINVKQALEIWAAFNQPDPEMDSRTADDSEPTPNL